MIDSMFQEGTDAALDDQVQRPRTTPAPSPAFSLLGLGKAPFQGIGGGVSKSIAFGAEITGAFGQVLGATGTDSAGGMFSTQSAAERKQADEARRRLAENGGPEFSNEAGDTFRARAAEILPDPKTTHASQQVVAGLADFATRAVGYSLTLGPLAPAAMGGDAALEEADRLKQQGVDKATRTKAGAVAGVLNAAAVAVPMSGATAAIRFGKGVAVGEGTIVGQSLAERAILRAAGYDKLAETFDPLDPVALAMGVVPGALGARFGHAPSKPAPAGGLKPLPEMGLGERQALRFDDVRLDAYAVQAAQRAGIPPEILLAVKNAGEKSGATATSPKGARGVMQFMPETWKEFGRGDPTDPMNSIDAGARYLKHLHDTYGDWDAAIAHYNGGGRQAAKVRSGQTPVPETAAYLERVRAYLGKTGEEHVAAAARAEPDLVPAARVAQVAQALEDTRLTPDDMLAGRDEHLSAVELAADQMGRGEPVDVAPIVQAVDRPQEAGTVRLYAAGEATDKPVRVTTDLAAVEALAGKNGAGVHYLDLPADHPALIRPTSPEAGLVPHASAELSPEIAGTLLQRLRADRPRQAAAAADQLRATRAPAEPAAPKVAKSPAKGADSSQSRAARSERPAAGNGESGDAAPATVARAAAEAALVDPEMLVHLEGMDAPVKVGELLAKVQEEARQDTLLGKLVEVAAACDLTA